MCLTLGIRGGNVKAERMAQNSSLPKSSRTNCRLHNENALTLVPAEEFLDEKKQAVLQDGLLVSNTLQTSFQDEHRRWTQNEYNVAGIGFAGKCREKEAGYKKDQSSAGEHWPPVLTLTPSFRSLTEFTSVRAASFLIWRSRSSSAPFSSEWSSHLPSL